MDYIEECKDYFSEFIITPIHDYIHFKRKLGTWGDEVEIQAISEIYNLPVIIFSYGNSVKKYNHQENFKATPITVSYH